MIVRSGKSTATSSTAHGLARAAARAGEDRGAGVDHDRQAQPLRLLVERAQGVEAVEVGVGLHRHVRRVQLQRAHAQVRGPPHRGRGVLGEARVHAPHGDQAVGRGLAVFGHVLVDALGEAHEVGAGVVDQHRALDAVRVHAAQELGGLFMIFCSSSTSGRPRVMSSSTAGFMSHQGWTWMWPSVTAHGRKIPDNAWPSRRILEDRCPKRATKTIVVVEDDEEVRALVERVLTEAATAWSPPATPGARWTSCAEKPGLTCSSATSPCRAWTATPCCGPCRPIPRPPDARWCSSPGQRDFSERVRAFRVGVVDYLTKPFTREVLLRKIERMLEGLRRPGRPPGSRPAASSTRSSARTARAC